MRSPADMCSAAAVGTALVFIAAAVLAGRRAVRRVTADELYPEDVPTSAERAGLRYEEELDGREDGGCPAEG